jgi:PIN domain nuclease of toxin-antitoxin system
MSLCLDTHVVVWLYAGEVSRFSQRAREALGAADGLFFAPVVRLELQFLREIGRISPLPETILSGLESQIGLLPCPGSFDQVARHACHIPWTRDPFDRLIVAQAALHSWPLVTKDAGIRTHFPLALW